MKLARDIMSLSTFKRDSNKVMRQMKKTKQPVVLTINGKAAVVVQDAEGYQGLLDLKERSKLLRCCGNGWPPSTARKAERQMSFSTSSSPRIRFPPKTDEKVLRYLPPGG